MSYRFASLSSGLLARKGAAQPAMASHAGGDLRARPAADDAPNAPPAAPPRPQEALTRAGFVFEERHEDAAGAPSAEIRSILPAPRAEVVVKALVAKPEGCGVGPACASAPASEGAGDPARRFHVSVRLKQNHFIRLKIASARLRKPSQDIVGEALTSYFRSLDQNLFGDCACARE